jgi:hypothetical protein
MRFLLCPKMKISFLGAIAAKLFFNILELSPQLHYRGRIIGHVVLACSLNLLMTFI